MQCNLKTPAQVYKVGNNIMRTQISGLINGSENTIRGLSSKKYVNNPIGNYNSKNNTPEYGGTPTAERNAIAQAVSAENPENIRILAKGVELNLARHNSQSGKSWRWEAEISAEQYTAITSEDAPVWTHKNAINRYGIVVNGNCTVEVWAESGKKGFFRILGEEFIEIL